MVVFLIIFGVNEFLLQPQTQSSMVKMYNAFVIYLYFCCMRKVFVFWVTNESYKNKKKTSKEPPVYMERKNPYDFWII